MTLWEIRQGDCLTRLREMPDCSVHMAATSPPYFGLRDYGIDGQVGLEDTPGAYVARLVEVFREVRRVLWDDGTLWLNLGDSFANGHYEGRKGGRGVSDNRCSGDSAGQQKRSGRPPGTKAKDLLMIPSTVATALRDDGWYLRSAVPWVKQNAMPESVTDRPSNSLEWVFLLAKRSRYYWDAEAVRVEATNYTPRTIGRERNVGGRTDGYTTPVGNVPTPEGGRNRRNGDWWHESIGMVLSGDGETILGFDVNPKGYAGAHFATWPCALVEPMIRAGTSARGVCPACGSPWVRVVEKGRKATRPGTDSKVYEPNGSKQDQAGNRTYTGFNERWREAKEVGNRDPQRHVTATRTVDWRQTCACPAADPVPATVLDPFCGAATTLLVATRLGRRGLGFELNPEYVEMGRRRLVDDAPLYNEAAPDADATPKQSDLFTEGD
jgi:DNA modification methylase